MTESTFAKTVVVRNLNGDERQYHILPLGIEEFFEVLHNTLAAVLGALGLSDSSELDIDLSKALRVLDFKAFRALANKLLSAAVIDGYGTIGDVARCEHFRANPEEMYLATFEALRLNYPDLFLRLRAAVAMKLRPKDSNPLPSAKTRDA